MSRRKSLAGLLATLALSSALAAYPSPSESKLYESINRERRTRNRHELVYSRWLSGQSREHSSNMAADHEIYHSDPSRFQRYWWRCIGENVGSGATVEAIHYQMMRSSAHRANILDRCYTKVGVGTWWSAADKTWYITETYWG